MIPAHETDRARTDAVRERETDRARTDAVRALEGEFSELITRMRRLLMENAERVSPGMLPGAYKVFTTIVRRERVSQSTLAEHLVVDKAQLSRAVRELEQLGLIQREPDPDDGRASILSPPHTASTASRRRARCRRTRWRKPSPGGPSTTSRTSRGSCTPSRRAACRADLLNPVAPA
ncbi:MAG: MarR family transcriptional regulator [Microbacterium sp.]